jgi:hypothetical protein
MGQAKPTRKNREFILAAVAFAISITAAPIYTLFSTHSALDSQKRFCSSGRIRRFHHSAPHIIVKTIDGEASLTLPSDPLSIKKRIIKSHYPIQEGSSIEWCSVEYGIFSERFITSIQSGGQSILSEAQAKKVIADETGLMSLLTLNVLSYFALYAAYKHQRET